MECLIGPVLETPRPSLEEGTGNTPSQGDTPMDCDGRPGP